MVIFSACLFPEELPGFGSHSSQPFPAGTQRRCSPGGAGYCHSFPRTRPCSGEQPAPLGLMEGVAQGATGLSLEAASGSAAHFLDTLLQKLSPGEPPATFHQLTTDPPAQAPLALVLLAAPVRHLQLPETFLC
ncbi:protein rtoA-like [Platysternon megacephalum]|uniref:Protein rtoA-like n=1 Tax=Platysternon megacephalum TaxID=55544 RepID=A0A4D9E5K5_9SAUR|nr:protein rtoA-like [Platysternon megacephalum]